MLLFYTILSLDSSDKLKTFFMNINELIVMMVLFFYLILKTVIRYFMSG